MKVKIFVVILITIITIFYTYLNTGQYESKLLAEDELINTYSINDGIIESNYVSDTGFIFYQGGKVENEAYTYLINVDAKVFIPSFPFNLAILNKNKADKIIKNNPQIDTWYIGGHSLGGTMAFEYAIENENIEGVVMLASYPMKNHNKSGINTLTIFSSNDGLVNYKVKLELYPKDSIVGLIEGGNHAQFGNYGSQKGDNKALIPSKEQRESVINFINQFISK